MNDYDIKYWRPSLIRLMQHASPSIGIMEHTPCYVDPTLISMAITTRSKTHNTDGSDSGDVFNCTTVYLVSGLTIGVIETPEQVNAKRNKALEIPNVEVVK